MEATPLEMTSVGIGKDGDPGPGLTQEFYILIFKVI